MCTPGNTLQARRSVDRVEHRGVDVELVEVAQHHHEAVADLVPQAGQYDTRQCVTAVNDRGDDGGHLVDRSTEHHVERRHFGDARRCQPTVPGRYDDVHVAEFDAFRPPVGMELPAKLCRVDQEPGLCGRERESDDFCGVPGEPAGEVHRCGRRRCAVMLDEMSM